MAKQSRGRGVSPRCFVARIVKLHNRECRNKAINLLKAKDGRVKHRRRAPVVSGSGGSGDRNGQCRNKAVKSLKTRERRSDWHFILLAVANLGMPRK